MPCIIVLYNMPTFHKIHYNALIHMFGTKCIIHISLLTQFLMVARICHAVQGPGDRLPVCRGKKWERVKEQEQGDMVGMKRGLKSEEKTNTDYWLNHISIPKGDSGYRGLSQRSLPITISRRNQILEAFQWSRACAYCCIGRSLDSFSCLSALHQHVSYVVSLVILFALA